MAENRFNSGIEERTHGPALVSAPMAENCRAIVILPVRNEEDLVSGALWNLARQTDMAGNALTAEDYEIIVLLNNCDDGSQAKVDAFTASHPGVLIHSVTMKLRHEKANIGHVRRLLMDEACRRLLQAGKRRGAILSTDADTLVPANWVELNTRLLAGGLDGVGGRIVLDRIERESLPTDVRRRYRLDIEYNLLRSKLEATLDAVGHDPWPRHHQHFGASLAVTAEAYRRVGGVPDVKHLEDAALWEALSLSGARLRHSPHITVRTSARLDGRAEVGLSGHLRGFQAGADPLVESAEALTRRYSARRSFRQAWSEYAEAGPEALAVTTNVAKTAELTGSDPKVLRLALEKEPAWVGALVASNIEAGVTRHLPPALRSQPLPDAVRSLHSILRFRS